MEVVTILILVVHLLAMNLAAVGPLASVWAKRSSPQSAAHRHLATAVGSGLAAWSFWSLALGLLTGGVLLLIANPTALWPAIHRFPTSAYRNAGAELLVSAVCLGAFWLEWTRGSAKRWLLALLALFTATNLLYHFPPLMAVIGRLAVDPQWCRERVIDREVLLDLMWQRETLALTLHFALSSLAVSAVAGLQIAARTVGESFEESAAKPITTSYARWALAASALQLPVGWWLLASLPNAVRTELIGGGLVASLAFMAALVTAFVLLQRLFAVAMGDVDRRHLHQATHLTALVVLLMTAALRLSRL